jgi:hypothetical protein
MRWTKGQKSEVGKTFRDFECQPQSTQRSDKEKFCCLFVFYVFYAVCPVLSANPQFAIRNIEMTCFQLSAFSFLFFP